MNQHVDYNDPFIAEVYDYVTPYCNRQDVPFFLNLAKKYGGPVLELGCGTGRILIPIAREGIEITGIDASKSMLEVCKRKLNEEQAISQEKVDLIRRDFRDFNLPLHYSLIIIPFRAFLGLLTVEEQLNCLQQCYAHLRDNGILVLDIFNPFLPYLYEPKFKSMIEEEDPFYLPDGRTVIRSSYLHACDLFNQILDMEFIYNIIYPDGSTKEHSHRFFHRYMFRFEGEHLLARVGLYLIMVYSDYDQSRYGKHYPGELIFIAQKRKSP